MRVVAKRTILTKVTTEAMFLEAMGLGSAVEETLKQQRDAQLVFLKEHGVPFDRNKLIQAILKMYKEAGIYKKVMKNGKEKFPSMKSMLAQKVKFAHDIRRFVTWSFQNYDDYNVAKGDKELTDAQKKEKELKKISNAWKTINNLLCDSDDEKVKEALAKLDETIKLMNK